MLPVDERAESYWKPLFNKTILHFEKAANAPIDKRVQESTPLENATIEWVPLDNLPVPDAFSEVGQR